jgi:hypothetical protein
MHSRALLVCAVLSSAVACSTPKPEPEIASSAAQAGYAEAYPAELQAIATGFSQRESEVKKVTGEMPTYPDKLKNPNYAHVEAVYAKADQAGKSYAYVERLREVQGAHTFFETEGDEISKKVAGAAQYAAKQKGCDVDVGGAAAHALKESVDKQLEKRLREANEAHVYIDRYRASLGKENAEVLEKQADDITYASYIANIEIVERKVRLKRIIEEAEQVQKTADEFIEQERKFQKEAGVSDADKKASEERIQSMNKSKASIESAKAQAQSLLEGVEERIQGVQKEYNDAFNALDKKVKDKAGGSGGG